MSSLKKSLTILFLTFSAFVFGQNIGINSTGATPNASAMLDIDVSSLIAKKGLLIPRITAAQKTAMNPLPAAAQGLLIYQTDGVEGFYYNISTTTTPNWVYLLPSGGANGGWGLTGNAGTVDGTNFIGTTDNVPLNFRVNNQSAGKIDKTKRNVFLGILAGSNTSGTGNVLIGDSAGYSNTTGNASVFIGARAGRSNTTTYGNIYIGADCGAKSTGQHNTYVGTSAGYNNVSGIYNTFYGQGAGVSSTGSYNTLVGYRAGANVGAYQVMIGYEAGSSATASGLFIGARAGEFNTGGGNTFIGLESGRYNAGGANLFIATGRLHKTGGNNIYLGSVAANSDTAGYNNTIVGVSASSTQTTGHDNTYLGYQAAYSEKDGFENVVIGAAAGFFIGSTTIKYHSNVYVGHKSACNLYGSNNTLIGDSTGYNSGALFAYSDNVTLLGSKSSVIDGISNATAIGYRSRVTASNALVLGNNVNVGIGTTAPTAKLEVAGQVKITGGTPGAGKVLVSDATGLASWQTVAGVGGQWMLTGNAGTSAATNFIGTTDAIDFILRTNNTEKMRVTSGGNVGIGTTAPVEKLSVSGAESTAHGKAACISVSNTSAGGTNWYLRAGATGTATPAGGFSIANNAAYHMVIDGSGNIGIGNTAPAAKLEVTNNSGVGITEMIVNSNGASDADFVLKTTATNMGWFGGGATNKLAAWNYANSTEPFTILGSNGNVGIGCTAPAYKLHVIGDIASSGTVRTTNALVTGAITACSDVRYKKDFTPIQNPLELVLNMKGFNYYWNQKDFPNKNFSDKKQIGFKAQELQKLLPEVVFEDTDGYLSVDYSKLTPVLVEAIKEQQKIIEVDKEKMKAMESMMEALSKRLSALENANTLTAEVKK